MSQSDLDEFAAFVAGRSEHQFLGSIEEAEQLFGHAQMAIEQCILRIRIHILDCVFLNNWYVFTVNEDYTIKALLMQERGLKSLFAVSALAA